MTEPEELSREEALRMLADMGRTKQRECRACGGLVKVGVHLCPHCRCVFPTDTNERATQRYVVLFIGWFVVLSAFTWLVAGCEMAILWEIMK